MEPSPVQCTHLAGERGMNTFFLSPSLSLCRMVTKQIAVANPKLLSSMKTRHRAFCRRPTERQCSSLFWAQKSSMLAGADIPSSHKKAVGRGGDAVSEEF